MILIDDRQARSHPSIRNALAANLGPDLIDVQRMEFGDYAWDGHPIDDVTPTIGVEYMSVTDLLGKIKSGRLSFQAVGLLNNYDVPIMLIEGELRATKDGRVLTFGYESKMSFDRTQEVIDSAAFHGLKIFYCKSKGEGGKKLVSWYRYWRKSPDQHKFFHNQEAEIADVGATKLKEIMPGVRIPVTVTVTRQVSTLMQAPGVGQGLAEAALDKYRRLDYIFSLGPEELIEIPGWGPKTVKDFMAYASRSHKTTGRQGTPKRA